MKTAEFVTPKHPDKMCDQIADAMLDVFLVEDPEGRCAIEVMGGHDEVNVTGEVTTQGVVMNSEIEEIVKRIVSKSVRLRVNIAHQSPEIARGVDTGGAGDQGIMRGYAVRGNADLMPQEYHLARGLCKFLYSKYPYDGKTQVTIDDDGAIQAIVASFQNVKAANLTATVVEWLGEDARGDEKIFANPAGDWKLGGFDSDTGLTGRKLVMDNYGPSHPIGGGSFSGKDPTKVDRSAAYMARKMAVDLVNGGGADEAEVELAYAIGIAKPVEASARIFTNGVWSDPFFNLAVRYDLTPKGIIDFLDLRHQKYEEISKWGHFGNNFPWDK